jgi:hypothetical protein
MVKIVERSAMEIRSGPVRAIFPQEGNEMTRQKVSKHDSLECAAELFTATLRQPWKTVPLAHE